MPDLRNSDRLLGALWGSVVGDALGVPAEFRKRADLDENPIMGMVGGGYHRQLPGTWSDDSSLFLIALRWVPHGLPPGQFLADASRWLYAGEWTARGEVFDYGRTTAQAIDAYDRDFSQPSWGIRGKMACGNGSIMRNLPISLWHRHDHPQRLIAAANHSSAITHAEPLCQDACALHALIGQHLLLRRSLVEATQAAVEEFQASGRTIDPSLARVGDLSVFSATRDQIRSDGYVVSTLEAALWCLDRHQTFAEAVLEAVNLGEDSDTTASVVGGLAGLIHGHQAIPREWLDALANKPLLDRCFSDFIKECRNHAP